MKITDFVDNIILGGDTQFWSGIISVKEKEADEINLQADYGPSENSGIPRITVVANKNNCQMTGTYFVAPEKKYRGDMVSGITNLCRMLIISVRKVGDSKFDRYWEGKKEEQLEKIQQQQQQYQQPPVG